MLAQSDSASRPDEGLVGGVEKIGVSETPSTPEAPEVEGIARGSKGGFRPGGGMAGNPGGLAGVFFLGIVPVEGFTTSDS